MAPYDFEETHPPYAVLLPDEEETCIELTLRDKVLIGLFLTLLTILMIVVAGFLCAIESFPR